MAHPPLAPRVRHRPHGNARRPVPVRSPAEPRARAPATPALQSLASMLIQAERFGTSIAQALRDPRRDAAAQPPVRRRGDGRQGVGEDQLPAGAVHLPVDVHRAVRPDHPRPDEQPVVQLACDCSPRRRGGRGEEGGGRFTTENTEGTEGRGEEENEDGVLRIEGGGGVIRIPPEAPPAVPSAACDFAPPPAHEPSGFRIISALGLTLLHSPFSFLPLPLRALRVLRGEPSLLPSSPRSPRLRGES